MSDSIRTALIGGGSIHISIETDDSRDFRLCVVESWEGLTGIHSATVPAADLEASSDPDGLLRGKLEELVSQHISWKARKPTVEQEEVPADNQVNCKQSKTDTTANREGRKIAATNFVSELEATTDPDTLLWSKVDELVKKIRSGLRVSLLPIDSGEIGVPGGVQVRMECINPAFGALRTMNRFLSKEKLSKAVDPVSLVAQMVYELSEDMYGC